MPLRAGLTKVNWKKPGVFYQLLNRSPAPALAGLWLFFQ